jgi:hypothetical protein
VNIAAHGGYQIEVEEVPQYYVQPLSICALSQNTFLYAYVRYERFNSFISDGGLSFSNQGRFGFKIGTLSVEGEISFSSEQAVLGPSEVFLQSSQFWNFVADLELADQGSPIFFYNSHTDTDSGIIKAALFSYTAGVLQLRTVSRGPRVFKDSLRWSVAQAASGFRSTMSSTQRKIKILSMRSSAAGEEFIIAVPSSGQFLGTAFNNISRADVQLRDGITLLRYSLFGLGRNFPAWSTVETRVPGFIFDFDMQKTGENEAVVLYTTEPFSSPYSADTYNSSFFNNTNEGANGFVDVLPVGPALLRVQIADNLLIIGQPQILPQNVIDLAQGWSRKSSRLPDNYSMLKDSWAVFFCHFGERYFYAFKWAVINGVPTWQTSPLPQTTAVVNSTSDFNKLVRASRIESQTVWSGSAAAVDLAVFSHLYKLDFTAEYTITPLDALSRPVLLSPDKAEYYPLGSGRVITSPIALAAGESLWWDPLTDLFISSAYWARKNLYRDSTLELAPVFIGKGVGSGRVALL